MRILLLCALIVALPAPLVRAQSLGELAAREKARREREKEKKARPAAKVYTEDDLPEGGTGSSRPSTPNPPPAPESTAPTPPSQSESSEPPSEADAALRERLAEAKANLDAARQELNAAAAEVERLKQDLNPMSTTYNTDAYVLFRLQGQLKEAADKADALRPKVAEAQSAYELAARHAGVRPPADVRPQ